MKIDTIFTLVPRCLYSVQFAGEPDHEFSRVFRLWNNATFLELFFDIHYEDLLSYWEYMSKEDGIQITRREATSFERRILYAANLGMRGGLDNLSNLFKPLHPQTCMVESLEKSKARGLSPK